ncbi:MAG TPA: hypothetical protein VIE88_04720 [Vicinamibacteria bacterium]
MARRYSRRWTPEEERELLFVRWIVGLLCGVVLVLLAAELRDGVVHWASDPISGRVSTPSQLGHHSSSSPEGIAFFILTFVLPSACGAGFALFPRVFGRPAIWGPALVLTLVGFAGLTVLSD